MISSEEKASMFEVQDNKRHQALRKVSAVAFTPAAIAKWEDQVVARVNMAVARIKRDAVSNHADIYKLWMFMTFDIITELAFGQSWDQLEQEEVSKVPVERSQSRGDAI